MITIKIIHNSQKEEYRSPFGAVPTGSLVMLGLTVISEEEPKTVYLRWWEDDTETLQKMELKNTKGDIRYYTADCTMPNTPQLMWYQFKVDTKDGTYIYANNAERLGGEGVLTFDYSMPSFQITVYDKEYHTPDWFKDSVVYQIFPDRFYGVHKEGYIPKKRDEYIIHDDWYAPISLNKHPFEEGPARNDFYGGNLLGIKEKLPYLKELGITAIYLNPVFDAYSNHKYDTADYKSIDPMFGTEQDFKNLCAAAKECGIRIILDGVFSHTGADSVYFNKYGFYGEQQGAYRDLSSPYRKWYQFTDGNNYQSWWGCSNLPNVNEMEESYLDYILRDDDAVIKKWLKAGASGWRLDVADELPDEFIKILRTSVKNTDKDSIIIGEVWEDASNKEAYGKLRQYLLGYELDSVMNYPFKDSAAEYLSGKIGGEIFIKRMMSILENYPKEAAYALLNIAGTHDTMRIKSLLGGMNEDCGDIRLSSNAEDLAVKRVKIMAFLQMTFFGTPCIYYGDEVGMEGGKDPYNRGTYPWRKVDNDLRDWYKNMITLRNKNKVLRSGDFIPLLANDNIIIYARKDKNALSVCAVNRGDEYAEAEIDLPQKLNADLIIGDGECKISGKKATLKLPPISASMYM